MNDRERRRHREAFESLPDYRHESPEHGMLHRDASDDLPDWQPPDGDVILRRVPDFERGLDFGGRLIHRVQTNVRWSVVAHSPDGFEWGYGGSGPADLSLNVLNQFVPPRTDSRNPIPCYEGEASATAWEHHQEFKRAVIAGVPWEGGTLSGERIREWIEARR